MNATHDTTEPWSAQLSRPPRDVPWSVRLRLWFGGFNNQFGWLFFGFGMIFYWLCAMRADIALYVYFGGELQTVRGKVTGVVETSASVHERRVFANYYQFKLQGATYEGVSYSTGSSSDEGRRATVEFPPGNPERSRIRGMRTEMFPVYAVLVVVFPAVGLGFMSVGARQGIKAVRLLRDGMLAYGKLVAKERTRTEINDRPVYELFFEFQAEDGNTYRASARTHETAVLEDEPEEPLLYDAADPAYATLLDHLPGPPRLDETGAVRRGSWADTLSTMFLPTASIVGHGTYAVARVLAG